MTDRLAVVCWRWGDKYAAEHVNRLRSMVRRNLAVPHDFYCITDDPAGLDEFVKPVPIWADYSNWQKHRRRLKIFAPEMAEVFGPRLLQIDLDMAVVGDLTPLASIDAEFCIWKSPSVGPSGFAYNPSLMLMQTGARASVWWQFNAEPHRLASEAKAAGWVGTDQAVIGHLLAPNELTWGERQGIYSFRDHVQGKFGKTLPDNAKVVGFYGPFDPADSVLRDRYPWLRKSWRQLRSDLLDALIDREGWTRGAELGVLDGSTYFHLLASNPGLTLIGVDAWRYGEEINAGHAGHRTWRKYPLERYRQKVLAGAAKIGDRAVVMVSPTVPAAAHVEDESLDFVFVDADHTEPGVRADIAAWLPKLKSSGWMLGHDYGHPDFPGVKRAVDDMLPGARVWPDYVWSIKRSEVPCCPS